MNQRGPPRKAKYSSMTDSETVLRRKDEKEPLSRSEKDHKTVRLQAAEGHQRLTACLLKNEPTI